MQIIGLILIAIVILLYFLWSWFMNHQKAVVAQEANDKQIFNILVKGVYSPNVIKAKIGRPIIINFRREESTDCSRFVNFPEFKIRKELPEGQTVSVEFTPDKKGVFLFSCDMSMYQGKIIIE